MRSMLFSTEIMTCAKTVLSWVLFKLKVVPVNTGNRVYIYIYNRA